MKIGLLIPSIYSSSRYYKGRIFAPLTPAVSLADSLVDFGHEVSLYASKDVKTKAKVVSGDERLTDSDPFYYLFRNRLEVEQKYATLEIIKRDFEYDLTLQAYKDAQSGKLDIIHSYHDFGAHYFEEITGFPTVYTLHDPLPKSIDTIEYIRLSKFKKHRYISISLAQRRGVVDLNFINNVYHGLNLNDFKFNNNPEDYLIYFGRVMEDKGADLAIQAALQTETPLKIATSFVMANRSGDYFEKKIMPFVDEKKVFVTGFMSGKEKSDYIKNAKAFIFPLRWDEPFGLTMIESMACGTPVIVFNMGSASEIVRDGLTGFIVDPDDEERPGKGNWIIKKQGIEGIVEAIQRIGEINRENCREHVEKNFTIEKMSRGYEKAYKMVLERAHNPLK